MKPIIENWNKFLNEDKKTLSKWEHKDAAKYAQELIDEYGEPDVITDSMVLWKGGISEFDQTYVKDESIPHDSPKPHHDFVYSTMEIDIPEDLMEAVAKASESIIVDQLKNEVTARCGDIFANAITLGFVQKLVAGDIKPEDAEEEYKKHILEGMLPDWFESAGGPVDEGKTKDTYGPEVVNRNAAGRKKARKAMGLEEKKKKKKKSDRCTRIAKRKYDVWPSAYASGAVVKCRAGKIWKDLKENDDISLNEEFEMLLENDDNQEFTPEQREKLKKIKKELDNASKMHKSQADRIKDIIGEELAKLMSEKKKKTDYSKEKESGLHGWFSRAGGKGKSKGWVDCNTCRKDKKTGRKTCKSCGRKEGEKRSKYPACRPTPSDCGTKGKGKKWGKKSAKKESLDMKLTKSQLEEIIQDELQSVLNETEEYCHIIDATYDDGTVAENIEFWDDVLEEAEYRGRKVTLNKPMKGDVKKSKVYVKNAKGNVVKVNFGDKKMRIRKSNPKARKSFRARHNCKNPGPKWKARYWSCKAW